MTYQEILEAITRHRANVMGTNMPSGSVVASEVVRKINEIEWALQAIAEQLRDHEALMEIARAVDNDHAD